MRRHRFGFLVSLLVFFPGQYCVGQRAAASPDLEPGIVVERLAEDCKPEESWPREGDTLLSWARGDEKGNLETPFDLSFIAIRERPRGPVTIHGLRGTKQRSWVMSVDFWCFTARPAFPQHLMRIHRRASQLVQLGRLDLARKQWRNVADGSPGRPWLYTWFLCEGARLLESTKRWTEAAGLYKETIENVSSLDPRIATEVLRATGFAFRRAGNVAKAREYYERRLAKSGEIGDDLLVASSLVCLGSLIQDDNPGKAEDYYLEAAAIYEKFAPASLELARSLIWVGSLASRAGNYNQAKMYYQRALAVERNTGSAAPDFRFSLIYLAALSVMEGDLERAEDYYREALSFARKLSRPSRTAVFALTGLGFVAWSRSQLPKAELYLRQALTVQAALSSGGLDAASTLTDAGGALWAGGHLAEAEKLERKAIRIFERLAPKSNQLAASLGYLGSILVARRRLREAGTCYRRSLAINEKLSPQGLETAFSLTDLGDLFTKQGNLSKAEEHYRNSLAIVERTSPGTLLEYDDLASLADISRLRRHLGEAARLYGKALDALERHTDQLGGGTEVRLGFRGTHQYRYRQYADALLQQRESEHAFQVLERSRARSLVEMLSTAHIDVHQGVDSGLLQQEQTVQQNLTGKSNQRLRLVSGEHTEDQLKALDKEIAELLSEREEVRGQIQSASPAYAALTRPKPLTAKEVQQQLLDQDTALLEYSLGDERSYLFALTPTTLNTYELPSRKKIEHAARRVYALLTARNHAVRGETRQQRRARLRFTTQSYQRAILELSRMILQPVAAELPNKRLLIVTDGTLAYIPFAGLRLPGSSVPLVANHEIVYLPSASALAVLRQQEQGRKQPPRAVAVLADPVFSEDDPRVMRSLPVREVLATNSSPRAVAPPDYDSFEADLPAHLLQRSIGDVKPAGRLRLNRLPYTRQEAQAIASSVPTGQGLQALDFQASRSTATSPDLAQYRIVHFATHGLLDSRHPELSGLVLSLVDEHGQAQNGFLELQDIYNLNLSADLVVLSACETALGKEVDGEGLVGLTRGFMYAGASRVMASLWRVDDEATAQLMKKFYEGMLQEGKTPAAALEEAQRWMQGQRKWSEPYYWAGFVLQGEWK